MSTTVRVKPSAKNALDLPPPVPLSTFDLLMPPVYFPLYMFFRPSNVSSNANQYVALDLISALADVLEYFPLIAGTIQPDESGKLYVHSDNRGADFTYELRKQELHGEQPEDLSPQLPPGKEGTLLAVKLTSFSCGAHVLVLLFSHVLIDLTSAIDFLNAFASQAGGRPLSTVPKQWTRNPLEYFPDAPAFSELPGWTILPPGHGPSPPPVPAPADQVVFHIPIQKLAQLKSTLGLTISTFQLLSALIWRASGTYCHAEKHDDEVLCLSIAANARERSPDKIMSKNHYFGNFISDVSVRLKKSELLSAESLSSVASAIQTALREQLTVEYIAGKVKTYESVSVDRLVPPHTQARLTSWPKELLDTQDLHFGLVKPGEGKVTITLGDIIPFPAGTLHVMMATEGVYRVQISVPEGRGDQLRTHEELKLVSDGNPQH